MILTITTIEPTDPVALDGAYASIEDYYTKKVHQHGATPSGVDWESLAAQEMRFVQLLRVCDFSKPFSLNDLGCGYGAILALLSKRHRATSIDYLGVDVSSSMVSAAEKRWAKKRGARFAVGRESPRIADYSIASGIFNVRLNQPTDIWTELIRFTLGHLYKTSRVGFAVNFLTRLPLSQDCTPELYRTDPQQWIDYCQQSFQSRVELLDTYGMREFTLHVYRR